VSVTIKDIAKRLNISPSTVSRALRDHPDISLETKRRVIELAKKLDYRPNVIARSLQTKKTNLIGIIVPEIKHHFFSAAISGIEEVAYREGYAIIVAKSNEDFKREEININALVENRVAGMLISISETTVDKEPFHMLKRRGVPVVFFDRVIEDIDFPKVVVDDYNGAFKAVEYLIKTGYRKIAHLAGPKFLSISKLRLQGYIDALKKYGIDPDERGIIHGGLHEEDGAIGFHRLINSFPDVEAIFAVNDPVAIGACMEIKKLGYKIPDNIAIVGFSNNPISSMIEPALTTIEQPAYDVGKTAANVLIDLIRNRGREIKPRTIVLKTKLIVRDSA